MVARPLTLGPLGTVHAQTLAERWMIPVFYKCKQMKSIEATVSYPKDRSLHLQSLLH